ncbi:MAG TPA: hypothetical protein VG456_24190 [Candidatus Sulfopaludibacter sp.]|jgi:hypothetical protein|nr:hypothetical protein [Candidatus Sulfopaludibacter sp.]
MAFDLGSVKSLGVPAWLRTMVGVIVLASIAGVLALGWLGLHDPVHKDWFTTAIQLSGTFVPLAIAALLFAFSTTGPETLRRKTTHLLLDFIPAAIKYAATDVPPFTTAKNARKERFQSATTVTVAYHPGDFYCRYRITFPDVWAPPGIARLRVAYLVMDLKVLGANMHLCVPKQRLDGAAAPSGDRSKTFRDAFRHTLTGAETAGCKVNEKVVDLELDNTEISCLVVVRTLSATFLSDPAEQLYLAQDLVAMLRSFWREQIDWFPIVSDISQPSTTARTLGAASAD